MEKFYTTATLEEIENYFRNSKKLRRKMTIIETSCSTLFYKPVTLFGKAGYSFVVKNRGDVREIELAGMAVIGRGARRANAITKSIFEMLFGCENFHKIA